MTNTAHVPVVSLDISEPLLLPNTSDPAAPAGGAPSSPGVSPADNTPARRPRRVSVKKGTSRTPVRPPHRPIAQATPPHPYHGQRARARVAEITARRHEAFHEERRRAERLQRKRRRAQRTPLAPGQARPSTGQALQRPPLPDHPPLPDYGQPLSPDGHSTASPWTSQDGSPTSSSTPRSVLAVDERPALPAFGEPILSMDGRSIVFPPPPHMLNPAALPQPLPVRMHPRAAHVAPHALSSSLYLGVLLSDVTLACLLRVVVFFQFPVPPGGVGSPPSQKADALPETAPPPPPPPPPPPRMQPPPAPPIPPAPDGSAGEASGPASEAGRGLARTPTAETVWLVSRGSEVFLSHAPNHRDQTSNEGSSHTSDDDDTTTSDTGSETTAKASTNRTSDDAGGAGVHPVAPPSRPARRRLQRQVSFVLDPTVERTLRGKFRAAAYTAGGVDWHRMFARRDLDKSGELDFDEFRRASRALGVSSERVADAELLRLFCAVDGDGSGSVDVTELVSWVMKGSADAERELDRVRTPGAASAPPLKDEDVQKLRTRVRRASWVAKHGEGVEQKRDEGVEFTDNHGAIGDMESDTAESRDDLAPWVTMLRSIMSRGEGRIGWDEFRASVRRVGVTEKALSTPDLMWVFCYLDRDGAGDIAADDVAQFIGVGDMGALPTVVEGEELVEAALPADSPAPSQVSEPTPAPSPQPPPSPHTQASYDVAPAAQLSTVSANGPSSSPGVLIQQLPTSDPRAAQTLVARLKQMARDSVACALDSDARLSPNTSPEPSLHPLPPSPANSRPRSASLGRASAMSAQSPLSSASTSTPQATVNAFVAASPPMPHASIAERTHVVSFSRGDPPVALLDGPGTSEETHGDDGLTPSPVGGFQPSTTSNRRRSGTGGSPPRRSPSGFALVSYSSTASDSDVDAHAAPPAPSPCGAGSSTHSAALSSPCSWSSSCSVGSTSDGSSVSSLSSRSSSLSSATEVGVDRPQLQLDCVGGGASSRVWPLSAQPKRYACGVLRCGLGSVA